MRLHKIALVTLIMSLILTCVVGCSGKPTESGKKPNEASEPEQQILYSKLLNSSVEIPLGTYSIESNIDLDENGSYVVSTESEGEYYSLLNFTDSKTDAKVVLCNKPSCKHSDSSCNAFVDSRFSTKQEKGQTRMPVLESDGYLFFKSDKLYVIDPFGDFIQMNKDGTEHRRILSLDSKYSVISGFYYNSNVYLYVHYMPTVAGDVETNFSDKDFIVALLEINLETEKCTELFSFKNELDTICLGIYQNKAYFSYRSENTVAVAKTQKEVDNEENCHDIKLYCYDLSAPKREYIVENIKSLEMDDLAFDKNSVYYHNRKAQKIQRLNLDSLKVEVVADGIDGYIEIRTVDGDKLYYIKDNILADVFSEKPKKYEKFCLDLNTKEISKISESEAYIND